MQDPPVDFDANIYQSLYPDLAGMTEGELHEHYRRFGRFEGRRAHSLSTRVDFAMLASAERALEIGPFTRPLLVGSNVKYADIHTTAQLQEIAPHLGLIASDVPEITWVVSPSDLTTIDERFDAVLTGHVIEHQPNLVGHLQQVSALLGPGGRYLVLAPDYRYCFDHFMKPSTIADVLDAHARNVQMHDPKSLIASRLCYAHNDSVRHWAGDHGDPDIHPVFPEHDRITRLKLAYQQATLAPETLSNEHAWYLEPDTFASILSDLNDLNLVDLRLERLYPTLHNTLEFWTILRKH
jgi:SAM-dependent methyltransferase